MLYNTPEIIKTGGCDCHEKGYTPQCDLHEPFIGLGSGGAPKIDYDLRVKTVVDATGIIPIKIDKSKLKVSVLAAIPPFAQMLTNLSLAEVQGEFLEFLIGLPSKNKLIANPDGLSLHERFSVEWVNGTSVNDILALNATVLNPPTTPPVTTSTTVEWTFENPTVYEIFKHAKYMLTLLGTPNYSFADKNWTVAKSLFAYITEVASRIKGGFIPTISRSFSGQTEIVYQNVYLHSKNPASVTDRGVHAYFALIEHYRTCTVPSKYGMGDVVKTFSIQPGEETTISIKTYKNSTKSSTKAQNIIDSFSEESANEFAQTLENEETNREAKSEDFNIGSSGKVSVGTNVSVPLEAAGLPVDVGVSQSGSGSLTAGYGVHNVREQNKRALDSSFQKHTASSSRNRKIEINTTTTETYNEGYEETITRHLTNINHSRVLNFIYRQMNQEYLTAIYLHDVSFAFSLDLYGTERTVKLSQLRPFLHDIFELTADADDFFNGILLQLCNVFDYRGNKHALIECKRVEMTSCCDSLQVPPVVYEFPQIRPDLAQDFAGFTIPGIILSTNTYVLPTDDLICEALLGGGEALDCYNIRLQQAAVEKADLENVAKQLENQAQILENQRIDQAMKIIDMIPDAALKATLYKKIFGDCCDVPQSGCCGCGKNDCHCGEAK